MKEDQITSVEFKNAENVGLYLQELLDEAKNEEGKKILDKVFDLSLDMLCIIGADGHFDKISKSLKRTLGYSKDKLLSSSVIEYVVDEDRKHTREILSSLQKEDTSRTFENRYRCRNGSIKWFSWCAVSNKEEKRIYAIARDITAQKQTEDMLKSYAQQIEKLTLEKNSTLLYAKDVQKVLVPFADKLNTLFFQSFVFYLPKEIVSGDFCWTSQVGDRIFIAAGSYTGSGDLGAMMRITCTNALRKALHEFDSTETSCILDKVRELLLAALKDREDLSREELNISLCCINKSTCVLEWSGANNQLLYVHNGIMEEMTANNYSLISRENTMPFTKHKMFLSKGDVIYLFSDGFTDQSGGENGKQMMYKQFKKSLIKLAPLSLELQKEKLQKQFELWKDENEEINNTLVIAVRL